MRYQKNGNDSMKACYWLEWILQYENICKQKNIKCICERRTFAPIDEKLQMDVIWIIWEILIEESKKKIFKIL